MSILSPLFPPPTWSRIGTSSLKEGAYKPKVIHLDGNLGDLNYMVNGLQAEEYGILML